MTPAFSHLGIFGGREKNELEEYSEAAKDLNILNFCGMMENDQFKKIVDTGAKTVRIVKPYADNGKVKDQMQYAESVGAFGIGMDIDHIFGNDGYDVVVGEEMSFQTTDMLRSYVELTKLPFVVKGVLSVSDAVKCAEIGAKAIIVSHHHGRIPYAVPPMMVLPEIKDALEGKYVKIIVDCGIATGADVFKALALGADAAAVGRSMMPALEREGAEGVKSFIQGVGNELRYIMSSTGFETVSDIDSSVLYEF
jgi:NAD(P)H-dependent flavin oxidoreductase YrpB (nitropropane dioxygenase family)